MESPPDGKHPPVCLESVRISGPTDRFLSHRFGAKGEAGVAKRTAS